MHICTTLTTSALFPDLGVLLLRASSAMAGAARRRRSAGALPALAASMLTLGAAAALLTTPPCVAPALGGGSGRRRRIDAVYNFGDSISDTGNLLRETGGAAVSGRAPYGETVGEATGRFSDGLLMIDYLVGFVGLPDLPPYLDMNADFGHGANFAVAGATVLDPSFFLAAGIALVTNSSLGVQLRWFKTLLGAQDGRKERLHTALVLLAVVGNDYNYPFAANRSVEEVKTYVPKVVAAVEGAAEELIQMGVVHLIVPGFFPVGCFPFYLVRSRGRRGGCLESFNGFSRFHNRKLKAALRRVRTRHPGAAVEYADYYGAFLDLLRRAKAYGFEERRVLESCCGAGGPYGYDPSRRCGSPGAPVCPDPSGYVSWDGAHLTQAAYRHLAARIFARFRPS